MSHAFANTDWKIKRTDNGTVDHADARLAVLMDIRSELQTANKELSRLNTLLHCDNFTDIPSILRTIRRSVGKRKMT